MLSTGPTPDTPLPDRCSATTADAEATCAVCAAFGPVAERAVYLCGTGTVVRCRDCSAMLVAVSRIRGMNCVEFGVLTALEPRQGR